MTIERKLLGTVDAAATQANYIEDCFSCHLYNGTGASQTITNGIDLATKGGLVWLKQRTAISWTSATHHNLTDTNRGPSGGALFTNATGSQEGANSGVSSFLTTGFSLGSDAAGFGINKSTETYASWTFRKQPKFFDVVTYTGDGTSGRTIAHSLGSAPGFIITKRTDTTSNWLCYHRSLGFGNASYSDTNYIVLNTTSAQNSFGTAGVIVAANSSTFTPGASANASGGTYVAYLFAHDAGGFGAAGTDSVVSCGSYTGTGTAGLNVTLGWEPQFVLIKDVTTAYDWTIQDVMRGASLTDSPYLRPNLSSAEASPGAPILYPNATGFTIGTSSNGWNKSGDTFIYLAIRRGPMKTPTDATKVFSSLARTGTGSSATVTGVGFSPDFIMSESRSLFDYNAVVDRLRGAGYIISPQQVTQELNSTANGISAITMDGFNVGSDGSYGSVNFSGIAYSIWFLKRAPGFFDIVCYTGTGSARTVAHNLGVAPELMIVKNRNNAGAWWTYAAPIGNTKYLRLNTTDDTLTYSLWNNTTPTSSVFSISNDTTTSGSNYVAYLFASCPGVSKVGSYTGSGSTKQIDCGFAAGARFVLIKRTDDTGDWYVWDTARGIVSGNDPYLLLNARAAEVTNTDYIDPYSAGFEISSSAPAAINASGGTFIYLAIA
jgi:hypothetical protein